jgi:hypothetical protein
MGGSGLVVGEASGPSGGSAGILGAGWHPAKRKTVVMQTSRPIVVRRSIAFITTRIDLGSAPNSLSDLKLERNLYAFQSDHFSHEERGNLRKKRNFWQ